MGHPASGIRHPAGREGRLGWVAEDLLEAGDLVGEDGGGGAVGGEVAVVEAEDVGVEQKGFVGVVGDGKDGEVAGAEPGAQAGYEEVAEGAVEAGEGFVEQKEPGAGDGEGAGEGDALALAAGKLAGEAGQQVVELEEGAEGGQLRLGRGLAADGLGEADVVLGGEVGQQMGLLGGVAEAAALGREVGEGLRGGGDGVVAVEGGLEAGDEAGERAQEGAFAGAGRAEQDGPGGGEGGVDGEGEGACAAVDGEAVVGGVGHGLW